MEYNILRDWLSNHQFTWEKLGDILTYHHNAPILFSSGLFFFLFIGFLMIYMSLRKHTLARIIYVTLFSLYFYYKSSGLWFGLLVFTATSDFLIAQCISHTTSVLKRKLFVTLSLCINLGMLGYFKYFNFLGELFTMAAGGEWLKMNIFLPVGISFFTFQSISYVIDVYRGRIQPLGRWIDYVFYVSFFPQLVAGPIVRARDFIPQMYKNPTVTRSEFGEGLFLILCGLFKKTVISDYISMNFVDRIFIRAWRIYWASTGTHYRFIAISRVIRIWRSVSPCCWDSVSILTSTLLTNRLRLPSFGAVGISPFPLG